MKNVLRLLNLVVLLSGCNQTTQSIQAPSNTSSSSTNSASSSSSTSYSHFVYLNEGTALEEYGVNPDNGALDYLLDTSEPLASGGYAHAQATLSIHSPYNANPHGGVILNQIMLHPNGKWIFFLTGSNGAQGIGSIAVNQTTGILSSVTNLLAPEGVNAQAFALDPAGTSLYYLDGGGIYTYGIDSKTGALTITTHVSNFGQSATFASQHGFSWINISAPLAQTTSTLGGNIYSIDGSRTDLYQNGDLVAYLPVSGISIVGK